MPHFIFFFLIPSTATDNLLGKISVLSFEWINCKSTKPLDKKNPFNCQSNTNFTSPLIYH